MQRISNATQLTDVDYDELTKLYAYPSDLTRPWVRANFVSSIDGAAAAEGTTAALGSPADKRVYDLLRELADVVLVGAGTVRAENYSGARTDPARRRAFFEQGIGGHRSGTAPPIAVVTARCALDPDASLFRNTETPPLIITTAAAPRANVDRLAGAGADIVEAGRLAVSPRAVLDELASRGLHRVLCEGGPHLFGELVAAGGVDELCLTTAAVLIGGTSPRISVWHEQFHAPMTPAHILLDNDGTQLSRWVRS